jgi:hypothetical protein
MSSLMAALAGLALQAAPLDDLYKFKAETAWTYKRIEDGVERKISARSLGEESGKVRVDWKEYRKDGELHKASVLTWCIDDGALTCTAKSKTDDGQDEELSFSVLKDGAKKDDTWQSALGQMAHRGTLDVTVPAGTYKNAVQTRLGLGEDGHIDFFLVPKVGLAKIVLIQQGKETQSWELTEFKPAK